MFGSSLLGGLSDPAAKYLHSKAFWGYFGALLVRGGVFSGLEGDAGKTAGVTDILGTTRLGAYAIAGLESVSKRMSLGGLDKIHREEFVNLGCYLLNLATAGIGEAVGSDVVAGGAASANIPLVVFPNLVSDMVKRTDITAGASVFAPRFALNLHRDWNDLAFTSLTLMIGGSDKPMEMHQSFGLKYKWRYFRILGGLDTNISFGDDPGAHVGGMAGFDISIPFNGKDDGAGISFGPRCFVNFEGQQYECAVLGGATF